MRLDDLMVEVLSEVTLGGDALNTEIAGLTADSRTVGPGFLFAALPGIHADGRDYISEAVERGAVAVLASPGTRLADAEAGVHLFTDRNPRRRFALLAARFHGRQPRLVAAVTGTNGKTSVVEFTRQMWTNSGLEAASLGTLGVIGPGGTTPGALTTPDPVALHRTLAELARSGVERVAVEASSHGLDQHRLDGVRVTVAAFTNLGRDHLDYHGGMDAYLAAKLRLFDDILDAEGTAVVNGDDGNYSAIAERARRRCQRVIAYGRRGADIRLDDAQPLHQGQRLNLSLGGAAFEITLPLIGEFQAMNALCALGIVMAGLEPPGDEAVGGAVAALETLTGVPGRLQFIGAGAAGGGVYVDYAHTPDALEAALAALRPHLGGQPAPGAKHDGGRLTVVLGCGGDRDAGKRGPMGAIAHRLAERVIVTDDNPRGEAASEIRAQIMAASPGAIEIGDRGQAIAEAVGGLGPGDIAVITGKGHETGQIVGDRVLPFNDAEFAARALAEAAG